MPPGSIDKAAIGRAFGRAAHSYNSHAQLQRHSGNRLLDALADHPGQRLLDAGSGTGYFSKRLRDQGKTVIALDVSEKMLEFARQQHSADGYLLGDIEQLPLADASLDLVFSNLAVQWCQLPLALAELHRVIRPGGRVAFSTLAEGSLDELRQTWEQLDGCRHTNRFLPFAELCTIARPYRAELQQETRTMYFADLPSLLHSLKGIGATWLQEGRSQGLFSRARLQALSDTYPKTPRGLPLSYRLVYGLLG